jgi:TonB family protein
MKKKKAILLAIFMLLFANVFIQAETRIELKLRVYEGARQGALSPSKFVTSSYIQSTIMATIHTSSDLEEEKGQIKRVFNLQDIGLLTDADLIIGEERASIPSDSTRHRFRLNGNAFIFYLRLQEWKPDPKFLVLFHELNEEKVENLLTTSIILLGGHSAIFGFEDRHGKPYFCSLRVTGPPDKIMPPPPPPPPPPQQPTEMQKKIDELEKGAIKAWNTINPPRLIKKIDPEYPKEAKKEGLKGRVYLAVRTDEKGNVKNVLVLKSSNNIFNEATIKAVKQWKYFLHAFSQLSLCPAVPISTV